MADGGILEAAALADIAGSAGAGAAGAGALGAGADLGAAMGAGADLGGMGLGGAGLLGGTDALAAAGGGDLAGAASGPANPYSIGFGNFMSQYGKPAMNGLGMAQKALGPAQAGMRMLGMGGPGLPGNSTTTYSGAPPMRPAMPFPSSAQILGQHTPMLPGLPGGGAAMAVRNAMGGQLGQPAGMNPAALMGLLQNNPQAMQQLMGMMR